MREQTITVKAFDAEHKFKYSWSATLLAQERGWIILYGDWGRLLHHAEGAAVPITNRSLEFYPVDSPYVISVLLDRVGELKEYYGRVILPPLIYQSERQIEFAMLGVDLHVKADFDYEILESPVLKPSNSGAIQRGLIELVELIERREGPFDREFLLPYLQQARTWF